MERRVRWVCFAVPKRSKVQSSKFKVRHSRESEESILYLILPLSLTIHYSLFFIYLVLILPPRTSYTQPRTSFAMRTIVSCRATGVASSLSLVYCLFSILYLTPHTSDLLSELSIACALRSVVPRSSSNKESSMSAYILTLLFFQYREGCHNPSLH